MTLKIRKEEFDLRKFMDNMGPVPEGFTLQQFLDSLEHSVLPYTTGDMLSWQQVNKNVGEPTWDYNANKYIYAEGQAPIYELAACAVGDVAFQHRIEPEALLAWLNTFDCRVPTYDRSLDFEPDPADPYQRDYMVALGSFVINANDSGSMQKAENAAALKERIAAKCGTEILMIEHSTVKEAEPDSDAPVLAEALAEGKSMTTEDYPVMQDTATPETSEGADQS